MGFFGWLTGRDEKESDVYANFERVDDLIANLKKVSTEKVNDASEAVKAAVTALNSTKGMAEYVGQLEADCYTGTFDAVAATIDQVGAMIQQKADNIKEYEESAWYEKLGSTFAMTAAKLGEGVLSVAEDLGDGVVSLVGWAASGDVEKWCTEFVEKEWSHDTFNFYYNSDFAKKSAFTEDSAIAGACKIAGSTAGYLFAGGALAGASGALVGHAGTAAAKGAKLAKGVVNVANAASRIGSSTTLAATAVGLTAGLGSGTETGLRNGMNIDDAFTKSGIKQGVIQGGLAFAGGKLGEKMAAKADVAGKAKKVAELEKNGGKWTNSDGSFGYSAEYSGASMDHLLTEQSVKSMKLFGKNSFAANGYQGYNDAITKAGMNFGANPISTTAAALGTVGNGAKSLITGTKDVVLHPIKSAGNALSTAGTTLKNAPAAIINTVKNAPGAVVSLATNPATPGVLVQGGNAAFNNAQAAENIAAQAGYDMDMSAPTGEEFDEKFTPVNTEPVLTSEQQFRMDNTGDQGTTPTGGTPTGGTPTGGTPTGGNPNGGGGYYPSGGGGDYSGGGGGGGDTTPTPTPTPTPDTTPTDTTPTNPGDGNNDGGYNPGGGNNGGGYIGPSDGGSDGGHSGGGFGEDGFSGTPFEIDDGFGSEDGSELDSMADIIAKGDKLNKIPTSQNPIKSTSSGGVSAVIPIAAGLSAAAAAGIGAKAYMDKKNNEDNGEDDEFDTDDWSDENQVEIDYDDSEGTIADQYLNEEDDYGYQADTGEKYGARNNDELAEIQ